MGLSDEFVFNVSYNVEYLSLFQVSCVFCSYKMCHEGQDVLSSFPIYLH